MRSVVVGGGGVGRPGVVERDVGGVVGVKLVDDAGGDLGEGFGGVAVEAGGRRDVRHVMMMMMMMVMMMMQY